MTEKKKWNPPSFLSIVFVLTLGFMSSRIVFTAVSFVYISFFITVVGIPIFALFDNDKEERKQAECLSESLAEPWHKAA